MSHKLGALGWPFVADELILRSAEPADSALAEVRCSSIPTRQLCDSEQLS
ncbi:hypothetical protein GL325_11210 [Aeromicrobium sp. 636]|uniref:Uncharacterized protein n=1 Tax=Aeromicrobium senzhongii TaxID=2663859 RepID=A0A8I0K1H2_9ACTN|nr:MULTISPECIES: hypothetical protein [Aeromicrobium]MBC9226898.1 hypothetical protein [Aeromicrobium senzhongii]MCQ3998998.1 hypothetical protein [Aeromicrobium sp. 636]